MQNTCAYTHHIVYNSRDHSSKDKLPTVTGQVAVRTFRCNPGLHTSTYNKGNRMKKTKGPAHVHQPLGVQHLQFSELTLFYLAALTSTPHTIFQMQNCLVLLLYFEIHHINDSEIVFTCNKKYLWTCEWAIIKGTLKDSLCNFRCYRIQHKN